MSQHETEPTLDQYVAEIGRHRLLSREEEVRLARRYLARHDLQAAKQLVVSNLRFVVKVAHEYRGYGLGLVDLVQEGNIGLIKAVQKFDPDKGYRLISYAVWWIRAYMQNYVMHSWSLVKLGTTQAQRKLFFKLRSQRQASDTTDPAAARAELAERLCVAEHEIAEMEQRLAARDFSLDAELQEGARQAHVDQLVCDQPDEETVVGEQEERALLRSKVAQAMQGFNDKERYIVERRLLAEDALTLQEIGRSFGVSRERARQIEGGVLRKLREALSACGLGPGLPQAA